MKSIFCIVAFVFINQAYALSKIEITGSSTVAPVVLELAKKFESQNKGYRINVQMGGSSKGIMDARNKLANFGMISRSLRPNETDLKAILIARDGIGIIANKKNPISSVTKQQVVEIFKGEKKEWGLFTPGFHFPVTVVNKADGRSTLELFLEHFALKTREVKASVVIGDNEQGIKTIAANPGAIGYVSIGSAEVAIANGVPIKLLELDGVKASTETVRNGTYPLSRELNLVTSKDVDASVAYKDFVSFILSQQGQAIVGEQSFVPLQ